MQITFVVKLIYYIKITIEPQVIQIQSALGISSEMYVVDTNQTQTYYSRSKARSKL